MPKLKANDAERLAVCTFIDLGGDAWRQEASAGKVKFMRGDKEHFFERARDIFGCIDVIAKFDDEGRPLNVFNESERIIAGGPTPIMWFVQLTTSGNKTKRKRALERSKWSKEAIRAGLIRVSIWTHGMIPDSKDFRKKNHFFRSHDMLVDMNGKYFWKVRGTIDTNHLQSGRIKATKRLKKFLIAATKNQEEGSAT